VDAASIIADIDSPDTRDFTRESRFSGQISQAAQRRAGSCKGVLKVLREDSDHLPDFKEYMQ
jgi:hypothetical protein